MHYELSEDISCCKVNGRLIFLDIARDRYFQIDKADEPRLITQFEQIPGASDGSTALGDVQDEDRAVTVIRKSFIAPVTSALERPVSSAPLEVSTLLEIAWIVVATRHLLKTRGLKSALSEVPARKCDRSSVVRRGWDGATDAALSFRRVRPYVPVSPVCLLDSLALLRFLARRGLRADLVFGVTGAPFSAHCWLQAGETILNDTLGNVESYTPIRVI
ncbi:lasso peptide biosynthesis B2 protein [Luteimonas fraxinea]|uniref:lasso peptide biosynthesis B2 protein n=1 Tax=Luteimonas fraxinea TaxID=2901869 RepID=UPI001E49C013|nr:lasso peptide biosynthesis B2 protein [Luteimonas fraxinea]UHH10115.1 lasso peptide biosynthesis B2 protein [Luteimonas fraxinea]